MATPKAPLVRPVLGHDPDVGTTVNGLCTSLRRNIVRQLLNVGSIEGHEIDLEISVAV